MDLRHLRHFIALAEETHYGRAAERLCISQPALSVSIARLEEDLGFRLFERDSKRVTITPAGELMLRSAQEMLDQEARTTSFAKALAIGKAGRIEVGFAPTVLRFGVDKAIAACRESLPGIDIVMREFSSLRQVELVRARRLDAGLVSLPLPPRNVESIELLGDRFVLVLPSKHPLARRSKLDLALLREDAFVMPSREHLPVTHDQFLGLCSAAGFYPRASYEAATLLSTVQLVAAGLGVGFVVESLADLGVRGVSYVPLEHALPRRSGFFVWNPEHVAPGLRALLESMKRYASRLPLM